VDSAAETVERELTILLRSARTQADRAARKLDARLDSSAYIALTRIADCGPMRAQTLAGRIGLDKSTVSRLVSTLAELGFVERVPDPDDGRAFQLRLTRDGAARLRAVREERRAELWRLLAAWSEEDRATFARLLTSFNNDGQALSTAKGPSADNGATARNTGPAPAGPDDADGPNT